MDQSTGLPIAVAKTGFYAEYNKIVALGSKFIILALMLWAGATPILTRGGEASPYDCLLYTSPSPRD